MNSDITYDGFSFADNGLIVVSENHMILPDRDNQIEKIAGRPGGVLVQSEIGVKPIPMSGYYDGSSATEAQQMYDTLAQMLNRQERTLEIPHAGSYRYYTATIQNAVIEQPNGLNRLTWSFEFVVPQGSSVDQAMTTLVDAIVTSASTSIPLTVIGSVPARPVITLTFTSVTGGAAKTVSIRNAKDFIGLEITRDFVTGDVVTIDSDTFQIYVNGVLTAPTGRMPRWEPGTGALFYSDTFTNREVHIVGEYYPKNL